MDNSCLNINYITVTDVNEKSFAKNLSYYGKPKGLKALKDQQRSLELHLDAVVDLQNDFANLTCLNLKPQGLDDYYDHWVFVDSKNGEVVFDISREYKKSHSEGYWILRDCIRKLSNVDYFDAVLKNPKTLKLKDILDWLDHETVLSGKDLLRIQDKIEKASKPAPVEDWRLVFVFDRVNVEVVGQAAKNLYDELLGANSDLNIKMHVKATNQTIYETKLALIADSYETL